MKKKVQYVRIKPENILTLWKCRCECVKKLTIEDISESGTPNCPKCGNVMFVYKSMVKKTSIRPKKAWGAMFGSKHDLKQCFLG